MVAPIDLDARRGTWGRHAARTRRQRVQTVNAERAEEARLQQHEEELELRLLAGASGSWCEALTTAQYLISLFATTPEAGSARRQSLVAHALDDLERLKAMTKEEM